MTAKEKEVEVSKDNGSKELTANELKALVVRDRTTRLRECNAEIQKILTQFRCKLGARSRIDDNGRIVADSIIIAE